jgi:CHAT domain-containing protein
VLGSWYYDRHEELFEYYLGLLQDDSESLLALSKFRAIHKYSGFDLYSAPGPGSTEQLRTLLAQRARPAGSQVSTDLDSRINEALAVFREPFEARFANLTAAGSRSFLQSLGNDEVVLTYHISPSMARVWVGSRNGVEGRNIANGTTIYQALEDIREGLADIGSESFNNGMDELGKSLVAPVSDLLTETIYWIPAGPLLGFPVDALRLKGHYLAERYTVVNLLSFPLNPDAGSSLQVNPFERVFLAGHPQEYSGNYAMRLDTSSEIKALADIFVGPGLNIVQGAALLADEFQDQRFSGAEVIHLTMPGVIDLKYPGQSSLQLSGMEGSPRLTMYTAMDIRAQKSSAELVVLSGTRTAEEAAMVFNNQPGLAADFIAVGAQSVIASFWATGGKADEAFLSSFYRRLADSGNIARSLRDAKREYIRDNRGSGLYDWAAYQLFIE